MMQFPSQPHPRRGATLAFLVFLMVMFMAIASLAVDYGHVQLVKTQMQRTADSVARGYMEYYINNGQDYANSNGPTLYSTANNPVDGATAAASTVTVTWGFWTASSGTFSTTSGTVPAVQVKLTRTASGGNAVPIFWGGVLGFPSADVHVSAVAAEMGGQSTTLNIPSTASLYLAGMPTGTTNIGGDNTSNATPYQVPTIPVTPGTWMTFTNLTGTTTVSPGSIPNTGPGGTTNYAVHHGQSWNNQPDSPGPENHIADAVMQESSTAGVFLTANAPSLSSTTPAMVDWTQSSQQNQPAYSNLQVQAPFLIGTGKTSGTNPVTQKFLVPPGATRLFIGIWDGYQYYNNSGSLTGTATDLHYVQLVQ
jgi:hypothetical protein